MRSCLSHPRHVLGLGLLATLLACGGGSSSPSGPLAPQGPAVPSITQVTTVAGINGQSGILEGGPDYAQLKYPCDLALDSKGNLFVADETAHIIRKITPQGSNTIFAGSPNAAGHEDGTGVDARFHGPAGLAIDTYDNLYVTDTDNRRIRKVTQDQIQTVAGTVGNQGSNDGRGATARFYCPFGLSLDAAGALYVADGANHTLRKVLPDGTTTTVAGQAGSSGFGTGPVATVQLNGPLGCLVHGKAVYVSFQGS